MATLQGRSELSYTRYNTGQFERLRVTKHKTDFEYNKLLKNITPQFVDAIERLRQSVLKLKDDIMKFLEEDSLIEANFNKMLEEVDRRIAVKKNQRNQEILKNNSRRRKNAAKYNIIPMQGSVKYLFTEPIRDCNHTKQAMPRKKMEPPSLVREISRINEKSLQKLRDYYTRKESEEQEVISESENLKQQLLSDYPVLSSMVQLMDYNQGPTNSDPMLNIKVVFEELQDTRKRLLEWRKLFPKSPEVEKSLQECIVRRVVKRPRKLAVQLQQQTKEETAPVESGELTKTASYRHSSRVRKISLIESQSHEEKQKSSEEGEWTKQEHQEERPTLPSKLSPIPSREASPINDKKSETKPVSTIGRKVSREELLGPDGQPRMITVTGPNKKISVTLTEELVETLGYIPEEEIDESVWADVQQCRYLRGHEPDDMHIPEGDVEDFVFHSNDANEGADDKADTN